MEYFTGVKLGTILRDHWAGYLGWKFRRGEHVRESARYHVARTLACRTPLLGYHLYECQPCGILRVVPHSCKSAFCSSCGTARARAWGRKVLNELLPVRYHHVVFTLPWQLRALIEDNRERLLAAMIRAGKETVHALTQGDPYPVSRLGQKRVRGLRKRHTAGFQLALHTFGSKLNWNPHLHLLVTAGGLSLDGSRWVETGQRSWLPAEVLRAEWRMRLVALIEAEHEATPLFCRPLMDKRRHIDVAKVLGLVKAMTWYVKVQPPEEDPGRALGYMTRYTRRPVIGEARIKKYDGHYVTFAYKDYHQSGRMRFMKMRAYQFIDKLVSHIPDKHARHFIGYGLFASRGSDKLAQARKVLEQRKPRRLAASSWEKRRKEAGEKRPLSCPRCGNRMRSIGGQFGNPSELAAPLGIGYDEQIPHRTYISTGGHPVLLQKA